MNTKINEELAELLLLHYKNDLPIDINEVKTWFKKHEIKEEKKARTYLPVSATKNISIVFYIMFVMSKIYT